MPFDLVIKNGRLVYADADFVGDIAISNGRIAAIGRDLVGSRHVDATDKLVIPGAIDGHVHMRTERESFCYDETFATGSVAAAFGGTTTIIDQIQVEPGSTLNGALDSRLQEAEGQSSVDFAFHMNIREESDERLAEIGSIVERGITSFKWFMAIPGWGVSDEFLMRGMWETADRGALNVVHAENRGVLAAMRRRSDDKGQHSIARFTHNYPAPTEAAAIKLALAMTEVVGGRTLIFHNTCREGVAAIRAAKSKGVKAYGEVCLAYLTHDDSVYRGDPVAALPFLVTPPIREAFHQDALWEGLARGDLDIISTDHTAMRSVPEFSSVGTRRILRVEDRGPTSNRGDTPRCCGQSTRAPVAAGWN